MRSNQKRYVFLDIAKGIAILSIILGHLGIWNIDRVVFTFHVPIFFLISGFLFNKGDSFKQFIIKRFRSLIVPYLVACFFIVLFSASIELYRNGWFGFWGSVKSWVIASFYGAGDSYNLPSGIRPIGAIWFLLATFWASIIIRCIAKYNAFISLTIVLAYLITCVYTSKEVWLPFAMQASGPALLFMYIGFRIKGFDFSKIKALAPTTKIIYILFLLGVWIWFIIDFKSFWLVHCDMGYGILDVFRSLCACAMVLIISYFIDVLLKDRALVITFIGRYSLVMLCAHIVELNTFPWGKLTSMIGVASDSIPHLMLLILLKLIWCIGATYIVTTHSATRMLFGYGKIARENEEV